jgi:glutathionylspermidine synthase
MERHIITPRMNWQAIVESQGLTFHSRTAPYWNEEACYSFSSAQIDELEKAGNDVHEMCLKAAQHIVDNDLFSKMAIEKNAAELILDSWNKDQLHLYGRFDFLYDGKNPPKLLEYNADTPTSLIEAAVIQWYWLKDMYPNQDQFNSLHERIIDRWKELKIKTPVYFSATRDSEEDGMTVEYLRDTADQAGLKNKYIELTQIGYNPDAKEFRDLDENAIKCLFKLWPWEWFASEKFGQYIPNVDMRVIEPAWKMLWSNKGLLPILWELNPGHPNLLPANFSSPHGLGESYVRKPLFSREGANVAIVDKGQVTEGPDQGYGEDGYIYQQYYKVPPFMGKYNPVLGLWMIGDYCCGMGIRETEGKITDNLSRFVPHYFKP